MPNRLQVPALSGPSMPCLRDVRDRGAGHRAGCGSNRGGVLGSGVAGGEHSNSSLRQQLPEGHTLKRSRYIFQFYDRSEGPRVRTRWRRTACRVGPTGDLDESRDVLLGWRAGADAAYTESSEPQKRPPRVPYVRS